MHTARSRIGVIGGAGGSHGVRVHFEIRHLLIQHRGLGGAADGLGFLAGRRGLLPLCRVAGHQLLHRRIKGDGSGARLRFLRRRGLRAGNPVKIQHGFKILCARGGMGAAQRKPGGVAPRLPFPGDQQQRPLMAGAEGDGARAGTQILGAAAGQIQNRVGNDRVPRLRRKGAGPCAALVAQQHKGALSHRGGHVHGGVVRAAQRQRILRPGRGGLHHIPGEFAQPRGLLRQPGGALGIAPGLAAEIKSRLTVL